MPYAPKKPCAAPCCPVLVDKGRRYCDAHTRQRRKVEQDSRPDYHKWYGHAPWKRLRRRVLDEEPLCAECARQGRVTAATEIDHITPHKGSRELFWDRYNLQGLCHDCHSAKTMREINEAMKSPVA